MLIMRSESVEGMKGYREELKLIYIFEIFDKAYSK